MLASDASASQLENAVVHPRVRYLRHAAECLPIGSARADLIAAAQAAHWFDFARFYPEVRRALRPGGVLALWTYQLFRVAPEVDRVVDHFYRDVVGPYWPPERRYVEAGYRTLPFPLERLAAPPFELVTQWSLAEVLEYVGTWSAVARYRDTRGTDPLVALQQQLDAHWSADTKCNVYWQIHLLIGRVLPI